MVTTQTEPDTAQLLGRRHKGCIKAQRRVLNWKTAFEILYVKHAFHSALPDQARAQRLGEK